MKIRYQEDPGEWRKSVLLTALGLALVSSLMRWRGLFHTRLWLGILGALVAIVLLACVCPRWFRGYYRFSTWAGFCSSQWFGRIILTLIFFLVVTPLALVFRLMGKDALRLKRPGNNESYWVKSKPSSPLDRQF